MADASFRPRAAIGGVPVHAMLVPFPIVGFTGALLCDLAYVGSNGQVQWSNFAQWLLASGEFFGALAALFGLIDLLATRRHARPASAWLHLGLSALVLVLGLFNNLVHARDGWTGVVPTGLTLSLLTVLALAVTGFLGHRLAYVHQRGGIR
ncbi:DUF2231 domain-containing protein [Novosphingobium sp. Gsoil 351]|uniref:DUF2231 domain-containing protein n=1 Tax=Novosphingobium sp. Gsoil 351 TaxID=2675225 RepID=UPI0012B4889C|nr:DUF2231 domain-containing protein [Novosphingobium sp. Gsoil 351]QGN54550.1 DUF2231 domain-containing protein [Novosphingobium sp. Gsoil 351]